MKSSDSQIVSQLVENSVKWEISKQGYRPDFFTFWCHFILRCAFTLTANISIMILLKISFVLLYAPFLSLLLHSWWFVVCTLLLQCETWISALLAGELLVLQSSFPCNATKIVGNKHSDMPRSPSFWSKTGVYFNNWAFHTFLNG